MCEPTTLLAAGTLAVSAGSAIAGASAQNKQSKATAKAARVAQAEDYAALEKRKGQEQDAATQTIMQADRQARAADALARVSAGQAGVAGASVDALLAGIASEEFDAKATIGRNLKNTLTQLDSEKKGSDALAANRIASAPPANPFLTGLQIAGAGLDFGTTLVRNKPKPQG